MSLSQIRDLHMKAKTIKYLKENTGEYVCDLEISKEFLESIQKAQIMKDKNS